MTKFACYVGAWLYTYILLTPVLTVILGCLMPQYSMSQVFMYANVVALFFSFSTVPLILLGLRRAVSIPVLAVWAAAVLVLRFRGHYSLTELTWAHFQTFLIVLVPSMVVAALTIWIFKAVLRWLINGTPPKSRLKP